MTFFKTSTIIIGKFIKEGATLNKKFRLLRILNHLTQEELAKKLGVSRTCVANWEKGIRTPDTKYISKYTQLFNVDFDFFTDSNDYVMEESFDISALDEDEKNLLYDFYTCILRNNNKKS